MEKNFMEFCCHLICMYEFIAPLCTLATSNSIQLAWIFLLAKQSYPGCSLAKAFAKNVQPRIYRITVEEIVGRKIDNQLIVYFYSCHTVRSFVNLQENWNIFHNTEMHAIAHRRLPLLQIPFIHYFSFSYKDLQRFFNQNKVLCSSHSTMNTSTKTYAGSTIKLAWLMSHVHELWFTSLL